MYAYLYKTAELLNIMADSVSAPVAATDTKSTWSVAAAVESFREALNKFLRVTSATLTVAGWSTSEPHTQTIAVAGVTADANTCHVICDTGGSGVIMTGQGNGTATFTAEDLPDAAVTVKLMIFQQ